MKEIEWVGGDRYIPPYGSVSKGEIKNLPDNKANSYIKQGLAVTVSSKARPTRKAAEED